MSESMSGIWPDDLLVGRDPKGKLVLVEEPTRAIIERASPPDVHRYLPAALLQQAVEELDKQAIDAEADRAMGNGGELDRGRDPETLQAAADYLRNLLTEPPSDLLLANPTTEGEQ